MALLGLPVQGVRTTGIYCRSDCVARPLASNLTQYSSPIAAQAQGYRPCLKCRPDRSPDVRPGGLPPAVEHALLLLSDGFLDTHREADLARQVGYSERQLRRLFVELVGATPNEIAMSRRAHFARRLLDDSDLLVGDIAFAAGFRSVRQMNRVMLEVFRFSPTELRAKRRAGDQLVADGGLPLRVPVPSGFSMHSLLPYLAARATPGVEVVDGDRYIRTVVSCGQPGLLEVSANDDHLLVTAHLPTFNALIDLVDQVKRLFGLRDDIGGALEDLRTDASLAPLIERHGDVRIPGAWDPFETTLRIILGQQITVAGASTFAGRLAERLGTEVGGLPEGLNRLFPTAEAIAAGDIDSIGLTGARARTVREVSALVATGELDLRGTGDLEADMETLTAIYGIGPWTAELIAFRVMGYRDVFPAGDLVLRDVLRSIFDLDERPDPATAARLAERWAPHRTLAAALLWAES